MAKMKTTKKCFHFQDMRDETNKELLLAVINDGSNSSCKIISNERERVRDEKKKKGTNNEEKMKQTAKQHTHKLRFAT